VVAGNADKRKELIEAFGGGDVNVTEAETGVAALEAQKTTRFDCVLIAPDPSDMSAAKLVADLRGSPVLDMVPIVVFASQDCPIDEMETLQRLCAAGAMRWVTTFGQMLNETSRFLHRELANLPEASLEIVKSAIEAEPALAGKKVLVVDDDVRNLFALTAALERHKLVVLSANDGAKALRALQTSPDVAVALMDIMMPGMDGYETIRRIRAQKQFKNLPIIALTAKAMRGDRDKCFEAGASDYISKPADIGQVLSLMRTLLRE
jgi:CheY-like chemotaxis protein